MKLKKIVIKKKLFLEILHQGTRDNLKKNQTKQNQEKPPPTSRK
jgi:hypothetical protein